MELLGTWKSNVFHSIPFLSDTNEWRNVCSCADRPSLVTKINGNFISAHSSIRYPARAHTLRIRVRHAKQRNSWVIFRSFHLVEMRAQFAVRSSHAKQINIIFYWCGYGCMRDLATIARHHLAWMPTGLARARATVSLTRSRKTYTQTLWKFQNAEFI